MERNERSLETRTWHKTTNAILKSHATLHPSCHGSVTSYVAYILQKSSQAFLYASTTSTSAVFCLLFVKARCRHACSTGVPRSRTAASGGGMKNLSFTKSTPKRQIICHRNFLCCDALALSSLSDKLYRDRERAAAGRTTWISGKGIKHMMPPCSACMQWCAFLLSKKKRCALLACPFWWHAWHTLMTGFADAAVLRCGSNVKAHPLLAHHKLSSHASETHAVRRGIPSGPFGVAS